MPALSAFFERRRQQAQAASDPPRVGYDIMAAETPMAEGVEYELTKEDGVNGWWARPQSAPSDRAILFLHGGGYRLGSAKAYRGFASQIAIRTSVSVFLADYPLAPELPFPAAYDAAVAARQWLRLKGFQQTAIAGDSAGGGLALATLIEPIPASPPVNAVAVFSPWTDLALSGRTYSEPELPDPIFQRSSVENLAGAYLAGADPKNPRASPLYGSPTTLPPIVLQVGTAELLLDDSRAYAAMAIKKGGEVRLDEFEGLHHVFQRMTRELPSARASMDIASAFISRHWR